MATRKFPNFGFAAIDGAMIPYHLRGVKDDSEVALRYLRQIWPAVTTTAVADIFDDFQDASSEAEEEELLGAGCRVDSPYEDITPEELTPAEESLNFESYRAIERLRHGQLVKITYIHPETRKPYTLAVYNDRGTKHVTLLKAVGTTPISETGKRARVKRMSDLEAELFKLTA